MSRQLSWLGGLTVAALVVVVPLPAGAAAGGYTQENLVSDQPGVAQARTSSLQDMRNTLSAMQRGWQQGRTQSTQRDTEGNPDGS